ncbi:MAG: TIGR03773 family transporter-associated surface protein [Acidimicrobiales bacterium]
MLLCRLLVVVLVLLVGAAPASAVTAESPTGVDVQVSIAPGGAGGLSIVDGESGVATRRVVAEPRSPVALRWDLTDLDPTEYRSDLVRVEVELVEGPGRLTIHTLAAHERRALVVDGTPRPQGVPAPTMVLQAGRHTEQRWTIDRAGVHQVDLRASIPLVGGGEATATASYLVGHGDVADDPRASAAADPGVASGGIRPAQAGQRVIIADGHVDIGPRIVDGHWRVQMKDDTVTPYVWRNLSDVVLHATDASLTQVPDRPAYAFLGAPGTPYYVLPQAQRPGVVWPGWNSQDPSVIDAVPGSVTWRLRGVDGPGRFVIYMTDSFGDTEVLFDSSGPMPQDLIIPRNSHVHGNWAFGASGTYRLTVEMRATAAGGETLSDTRVLSVAVGSGTDPAGVVPTDPGGPGQPVGGADGDAEVPITTELGDGTEVGGAGAGRGSGGGGAAGGSLVRTGVEILPAVALAAALIGIGWCLVLANRARRTSNESHS